MFTGTERVVVRVVYVEPTDSVIELPCQARQSSRWHAEQSLDLVRSELNSELETGAGRVPEELLPETVVGQQPTERAFHVALAHHARLDARIAPRVFPPLDGCSVRLRT